jgi:hypothetical protein
MLARLAGNPWNVGLPNRQRGATTGTSKEGRNFSLI